MSEGMKAGVIKYCAGCLQDAVGEGNNKTLPCERIKGIEGIQEACANYGWYIADTPEQIAELEEGRKTIKTLIQMGMK